MRKQYFSIFFLFFLCIPYLFSIFFANFARDFIKKEPKSMYNFTMYHVQFTAQLAEMPVI